MSKLSYGYLIIVILAIALPDMDAQNYIGMQKDEIIQEMKKMHLSYKLNSSAVNPYYKYLKYEDKINEITILFFLSDDDVCTLVRKMCDYANINDEVDELNQRYKSIDKNNWKYEDKGKTYIVTLEEGEWYFTVTTKLKK
jgi:hypothetical protein